MRQTSEQNNTDKRIKMQVDWEADVSLLFGRLIGVVKDDAIV
jgi:hypothetical protein